MTFQNRQTELMLNTGEDLVDDVVKKSRGYLPHLARFGLIATYLEDSIRIWFEWDEHRTYIDQTWSSGERLANLFVVVNLFGQLLPCLLILLRKQVKIAVYILFGIILLKVIAYHILWNVPYLLRLFSLVGGLLLLLVDNTPISKRIRANDGANSRPSDESSKNIIHLIGRVLVIGMFLTLIRIDWTVEHVIINVIGTVLFVFVAIGYKTKVSALTLCLVLAILNVIGNDFWNVMPSDEAYDFMKYDFFQTMSVIGGLLFVVSLGPGGVSIEEYKKQW